MSFKKSAAIALCFFAAFSLSACKNNTSESTLTNSTADAMQQQITKADFTESSDKAYTSEAPSSDIVSNPENVEESTKEAVSDEAEPGINEIVKVYKSAAAKTHPSAKSQRNITLKSIDVNNGQYEDVFEFLTPIMAKILARNSTEVDGITGGFTKLTESDIKAAKAYKQGNSTVIEMAMKNQISGPREDMNEGSVGHAMAVVGDIGVVVDQLKEYGLPMEISDEDTSIHYSNARLKVTVDANGKITSGTWSYTVDIRLNNYKVFGKNVETTSVVMVNTITL